MRVIFKKWLFRVIDLLLLPFVLLLLPLLKFIRRYGIEFFPLNRSAFSTIGVFPIRDHFYEPQLRYSKTFDAGLKRKLHLDYKIDAQLESLKNLSHIEELVDLQSLNNGSFGHGDAELYYLLIRNQKPKRIIEVGSGYSTMLAIQAIHKNKSEGVNTILTCIDPFEKITAGKTEGIHFIRERVETLDPALFLSLESNDILFIDSSHIIRPENDVLFLYQQVIPLLKKGVLIHVHDIFTPRHYRQDWLTKLFRFWNEQYLLETFLYANESFQICYTLNYLKHDYWAELKKIMPQLPESCEPSSFWMKKVK